MAEKRRRMGMFRQMVNVSGWMGFKNLKQTGADIVKNFKEINETDTVKRKETFEEAMHRYSMDEIKIQNRIKQCYYTAWVYAAVALILFMYGVYLLFLGTWLGTLVAFILTALAGALAYRESFWYFQMTIRKLGCTFKEYLAFILGRK